MSSTSSNPSVGRRGFLKSSVTLAAGTAIAATTPRFLSAAERARSIGANSRIRIAQIGCGGRGRGAHLAVDNWHAPTYSAEGGPKRDGKIRGKVEVTPIERPDHFLNWLQCMRTGETPHASIDAGYQHAIAVLMAVISYDTGKRTLYDHAKRKISTV